MPSQDLIWYIPNKGANILIDIEFFWVKCHQDDYGEIVKYEGDLNIQCDSLAKKY